ncbi:MAG: S46 family peptidase, partial [Steroidobacter sp.]
MMKMTWRIAMRVCTLFLMLICGVLFSGVGSGAEGMWTLDNLPRAQLKAQYQFDPDDQWVQKVMHASLRLAQGCSGSFVSPNGLVLTNHHCAHHCIESLSTKNRNLIEMGFLAASREQEIRCPELELNQLQQITDVTGKIQSETQGKEG